MTLAILGLGTAVPAAALSRQEGERIAQRVSGDAPEQQAWLRHIYAGAGIERRHFSVGRAVVDDVLQGTRHSGSPFLPTEARGGPTTGPRMETYRTEAPALALRAAGEALKQSAVDAQEITHVVTVSCTGFFAPGFDVALIRGLNLRPTTARTHVGFMGCHGALNGLRVASAFTAADPTARVLLCAAELCSLHYHYGWDPPRLVANALFADGAAAIVAGPGDSTAWQLTASGACLLPDSESDMTWSVGDYGFEMTLSKRVPGLIARHLKPWLTDWLSQYHLQPADVASWAIHPGGPRILDATAEALDLPAEAVRPSREVFANYGNMSSPTVLFIIDSLRKSRASRPCVALGFGPGLCVEAALFQ